MNWGSEDPCTAKTVRHRVPVSKKGVAAARRRLAPGKCVVRRAHEAFVRERAAVGGGLGNYLWLGSGACGNVQRPHPASPLPPPRCCRKLRNKFIVCASWLLRRTPWTSRWLRWRTKVAVLPLCTHTGKCKTLKHNSHTRINTPERAVANREEYRARQQQ